MCVPVGGAVVWLSSKCGPDVSDDDRLTRRKSLVDTVSLQVDIMSNSLPDKVRDSQEHETLGRDQGSAG